MTRSEIDRRAKHDCPRQCVADYGMHRDAPPRRMKKPKRQTAMGSELTKWLAAKAE
jgi:hypothetical protein